MNKRFVRLARLTLCTKKGSEVFEDFAVARFGGLSVSEATLYEGGFADRKIKPVANGCLANYGRIAGDETSEQLHTCCGR